MPGVVYKHNYENLKKKYSNFYMPKVVVKVNDAELTNEKKGFPVGNVVVDLTSGYEASIAEFSIFEVYDITQNEFLFESIKKYILLGSKVEIEFGYSDVTTCVFIGVITRVNFLYEADGIPCVKVTAMDVKGVMMAGSYERQLTATTYAEAVAEILARTSYEKLKDTGIITKTTIQATPDKQPASTSEGLSSVPGAGAVSGAMGAASGAMGAAGGAAGAVAASDITMEMTAESDYEYVVKAGKRNNFEFYTECGEVIFRKAKSGGFLMELDPTMGMDSFDITYDITGIVDKVIVRGMDVSKAKLIKHEKKLSNTLSQGNKAKVVISGSQKVYVDSTVSSTEDAAARASSLAEKIAYRYGSLSCELIGVPELLPGYYINLYGLGTGADNYFYLNKVRHELDSQGRYSVSIEGVCSNASGTDVTADIISNQNSAAMLATVSAPAAGGGGALGSLGGLAGNLNSVANAAQNAANQAQSAYDTAKNAVNQAQSAYDTAKNTASQAVNTVSNVVNTATAAAAAAATVAGAATAAASTVSGVVQSVEDGGGIDVSSITENLL